LNLQGAKKKGGSNSPIRRNFGEGEVQKSKKPKPPQGEMVNMLPFSWPKRMKTPTVLGKKKRNVAFPLLVEG